MVGKDHYRNGYTTVQVYGANAASGIGHLLLSAERAKDVL